jgi:hypothetical protein
VQPLIVVAAVEVGETGGWRLFPAAVVDRLMRRRVAVTLTCFLAAATGTPFFGREGRTAAAASWLVRTRASDGGAAEAAGARDSFLLVSSGGSGGFEFSSLWDGFSVSKKQKG